MVTSPPQIEDVLALSPLQEGLFALHRLARDGGDSTGNGGIDLYSMQFVIDIDGPVDVALLRRSAEAMLVRHPNLRAVFWDRDVPRPVQIVPVEVELPWTERIAMPTEFDAIARSERRRPFDLGRGPALRFVLIAVPGATRRRMIFTAHHILVDGWALAVFFTELLAVYRAGGSLAGLPPVRPYRDYIGWLGAQDRAGAVARWREYLRDASGPLMVADGSVVAGDGVPEKAARVLSAAETARLQNWAAGTGLTLSTAVLFAWAVVLAGLVDRRDVVFGTVISGRPESLAGVQGMVGLFINAVPVVHRFSRAEPVVEQCRRLQRELSQMRDIGYCSLSELQREHGSGILFDTLFVFENAPIEHALRPVTEPDGTRFIPVEMDSLTHYPLTVVSHLTGDALVVVVEAIRSALPHLPAAEISERVLTVLRQLPTVGAEAPVALDILTPGERAEVAALAARPAPAPGRDTLWEVFDRQASATPDAEALSGAGGERYTYAELHAAATRLARELAVRGVGPETVVALALPRSPRSIIAILGVLAAGGAYLPVDVTLPEARIASMLRQANPVVAVTETGCAGPLGAGLPSLALDDMLVAERISQLPAVAPKVRRHPGQAAYVIFTSGSTGEPKGVTGTNAALLRYFEDHRERVYRPATARLGRPLRIAHAWALSFDASWQPMVGLLDGHAVHLFDTDEMRDADRLVHGLARHRIDMIDTTPSMFVQLRAAGLSNQSLSVLALGGEAIDTALWEQLGALSPTAVYNCYGPTETTVEAVVAPVAEHRAPSIGTVNAGTFGYVLDSALRIVPNGVVGEFYLGGAQLTRGYAARPELTAARFVADPLRPGQRMYRTGDLVRRLPHGGYAYIGRADSQVKVRGYRVEIGDVEAALRGRSGVADAAVSVRRGAAGTSLVGFVVWQADARGDPVELRAALTGLLPAYMVPARIVALPQLPVNANGKLDARALDRLAEDALARAGEAGTAAEPTDTERLLGEVFAEQLNGAPPHLDDDFFTLGLDSIVAISVVHKARRLGLALSPRLVFTAPTIRQLAAAIDGSAGPNTTVEGTDYGVVPPLPIVSWLHEYGNYRRFTNSVLLRLPRDVDRPSIESMLQLLLDGHHALRAILTDTPEGPRLVTREPGVVRAEDLLTRVEISDSTGSEFTSAITRQSRKANDEIDPRRGGMLRAVWVSTAEPGELLLITAHHLVVDVVSWHILLGDIAAAWQSAQSGAAPKTLPEFTSYRRWSELLWQRAASPQVDSELEYWLAQVRDPDPALGRRHPDPDRDTWSTLRATAVTSPADTTTSMLAGVTGDDSVSALLLAAVTMSIASWRHDRGRNPAAGALIALDGHGRADDLFDTDTTNTVGWFTSAFPVRFGAAAPAVLVDQAERDPGAALQLFESIACQLTEVPYHGLDYGLLRYVRGIPELQRAVEPQIMFSYLGRLDLGGATDQPWSPLTGLAMEALPIDPEPDLPLRFALYVSVAVRGAPRGAELITNWLWSDALFAASDIDILAGLWRRSVAALTAALAGKDRPRHG